MPESSNPVGTGTTEPALACIACGRQLQNAVPRTKNQPWGGLAVYGTGHYGSEFDPMDSSFLLLSVCDPCLERGGKAGRVLLCRKEHAPEPEVATIYERYEP